MSDVDKAFAAVRFLYQEHDSLQKIEALRYEMMFKRNAQLDRQRYTEVDERGQRRTT